MTVFTWMTVLIILTALLTNSISNRKTSFFIIVFILLFAGMGLRDVNTGGSDSRGMEGDVWGSYPLGYEKVGKLEWSEVSGEGDEDYNIGFYYFEKLIYELTDGDYQAFISILSAFILFSYLRFIKKYSPSPIQSVLYFLGLMYYSFMFDALKQAMAMSVLLYSFDAIIEKKPLKYIFVVLVAAQFHFPALVFLPAYWIGRINIGKNYLIFLAVLLVMTYIFRDQLLDLMLSAYGEEKADVSMEGIRFLRNKALVMIVIVVVAVVLRPPVEDDYVYNASLMFAGVAIVFQTFCGYNNIFERLADYYFHTSIILIPLVFEKIKQEKYLINPGTAIKIKSVAPWLFCAFAVWRFLSTVNNSPIFMTYDFLWK